MTERLPFNGNRGDYMGDSDTVSVPTSASNAVDQLRKSYDAEVKNFLKEKQILAIILKSCVAEFKDCSVEDIASKYIEGIPQVAAVAVDQDAEVITGEVPVTQQSQGSKITGASNEDKSRNEGLVTYDIRFTAVAPKSGELIKLIVNVEAQRETDQTYAIVTRGIYYGARLISAQKNVEFSGMHYENIKKVYSIWICQDVPKDKEHSIVAYDITERVIAEYRKVHPEPVVHYDLMSVVILGLGDPNAEGVDDVLKMLSTALSEGIDVNTKKKVLSDEFGIRMTETIERTVDSMCNLSYGIAERANLKMLYELVHDGDLSLDRAAKKAGLSEEEFKAGMEEYYSQLASA